MVRRGLLHLRECVSPPPSSAPPPDSPHRRSPAPRGQPEGSNNVFPLVPGSTERLRAEIRTRSEGLLLAGGVGSRIFRSRIGYWDEVSAESATPAKFSTGPGKLRSHAMSKLSLKVGNAADNSATGGQQLSRALHRACVMQHRTPPVLTRTNAPRTQRNRVRKVDRYPRKRRESVGRRECRPPSSRTVSSAPRFAELDEALEAVGDIFIRWNAIIAGIGLISIQPFPQYDWVAPLRVPWIIE